MAGGMIITNNFSKDLENLGNIWYGDAEKSLNPIYKELFKVSSTKNLYEYFDVAGGLGLAQVKPEGANIQFDSMTQGPRKILTQATIANGFIVTEEAVDFAKVGIVMKMKAAELAKSLSDKKDELCADVFDNAFDSAYAGADGKELCATDHPIQGGLTVSNELAAAADLSEASIEQMVIEQSQAMKDYRGKRVIIPMKRLIVSRTDAFEAARILDTVGRVHTPDNTINAIKNLGILPGGYMVHDRVVDQDAFFIECDVEHGLILLQSKAPTFRADNGFDNLSMKFTAHERYALGFVDHRCLFGTPGAA